MAATTDYWEMARARLRREAGCRVAMLEEITDAIVSDDLKSGGSLLRKCFMVPGGFAAVGESIGASGEAVERMLAPGNNPSTQDLLRILACLQEREGMRFDAAGVYCRRGARRRDRGELDAAIADFDEAIRLDPQNKVAARQRVAAVALRDGRAEQSAAAHRLRLAAAK